MALGLADKITRRAALVGGFVLAGGCLAACSAQGDLAAGEQGRIARITDGDTLALDTGLKVRLAEIEAPAPGYDGREDQPFAGEARGLLAAAAVGRAARLWYGGLSRDSYGRAIAHVIASDETGADVWLNGYLARQGGAWVRTYPDNARRARRLLAFEAEARAARRGLWSHDHWRIRASSDLDGAPPFAILEGACLTMEEDGDSLALITPAGFRLTGVKRLGKPDIALRANTRIRLRGRLDMRTEPMMRLTHWAQVEVA